MKDANREVLDRGSLPQLLLDRVRHTSDRRLVADAASGMLVAAVVAVLRPPFWGALVPLALCLGLYGIWGILDRELWDADLPPQRARVLTVARGFIGALGVAVAILFGVTLFFGALGTWIS
jgi:hypothetical protein